MFESLFAVCPVPHDLVGGAGNCPATDLVLLVMATFWFGYLVRGYLQAPPSYPQGGFNQD